MGEEEGENRHYRGNGGREIPSGAGQHHKLPQESKGDETRPAIRAERFGCQGLSQVAMGSGGGGQYLNRRKGTPDGSCRRSA